MAKVDKVLPNTRTVCTSRAGNVRECPEILKRHTYGRIPCPLPVDTMSVAANGELLLCCQDWRHEAVVGTWEDMTAAREYQLECAKRTAEIEICRDCIAGKTAEEVGERLGKRNENSARKLRPRKKIRVRNVDPDDVQLSEPVS